ncbi:UNVERIFIED_CONTAM: hypothetical protein K2H54_069752 [Gekko kuhli]
MHYFWCRASYTLKNSKKSSTGPDDSSAEDEDIMVVGPMEGRTMTNPEMPQPSDRRDDQGICSQLWLPDQMLKRLKSRSQHPETEIAEGPMNDSIILTGIPWSPPRPLRAENRKPRQKYTA